MTNIRQNLLQYRNNPNKIKCYTLAFDKIKAVTKISKRNVYYIEDNKEYKGSVKYIEDIFPSYIEALEYINNKIDILQKQKDYINDNK